MAHEPDWPNLAAMMFEQARQWPDRTLFRFHRDGAWHTMSWRDFAARAAACARGLQQAGVGPGDRVVICAENRPEIIIAEVALMAIGAVPVPAYVTNTADDHAHILRDSGARLVIVSTPVLAGRVRQAALTARLTLQIVAMQAEEPGVLHFDDLLSSRTAPPDDIADEAARIPAERLACLIYTSGTGGAPKGVMLPHRSMLANMRAAATVLRPLRLKDETYLSFLPLSHAFEHTVGNYFLASIGTEIVHARGLDQLAADLLAIRPTIMVVVPRLLEVIRDRVRGQIARQPAWRRGLLARAMAWGVARQENRLTLPARLPDQLLGGLVRRQVRARLGGRLRALVSGGARLDPAVGRFFQGLGIVVMQGYGQTEAGPVIGVTPPDRVALDTVGPPFPGVTLRIADDGEILVRGDLVMLGYWNDPQATALALQDGWLHTGDIGTLDAAGNLRITDRKKDLIVLSGGDNVSPARIEALLMAETEIAQAVVAGDGRASLVALLVPADGIDQDQLDQAVARVNTRMAPVERIRRHAVVPGFTQENGLVTPTQKIRRALVLRAHHAVLATL